MGGGSWTHEGYSARVKANAAAGKSTFEYSDRVRRGEEQTLHALLDPTKEAGPTSPFAGKVMREVCVTPEHPDPTAMLLWLDVTGSNYTAAKTVHSRLPDLQNYLKNGNFCNDPQINVSAIGDAYSDRFPLQFGQYESDNRLDDQISVIVLERGGGGQVRETYELGAYMAARHVNLEPFHKYGKKGFVFFLGDEMPYSAVEQQYGRHTLTSLTGDSIAKSIATKDLFDELQQQNHVFFLFQEQGAYEARKIVPAWERLIGKDNIVRLKDPQHVVEVIAAVVARVEKDMTDGDIEAAMIAAGGLSHTIKSAIRAVERVKAGISAKAQQANIGELTQNAKSVAVTTQGLGGIKI